MCPRSLANAVSPSRIRPARSSCWSFAIFPRDFGADSPVRYFPVRNPAARGRYGMYAMSFAVQKGSTSSSTWRRSTL